MKKIARRVVVGEGKVEENMAYVKNNKAASKGQ